MTGEFTLWKACFLKKLSSFFSAAVPKFYCAASESALGCGYVQVISLRCGSPGFFIFSSGVSEMTSSAPPQARLGLLSLSFFSVICFYSTTVVFTLSN